MQDIAKDSEIDLLKQKIHNLKSEYTDQSAMIVYQQRYIRHLENLVYSLSTDKQREEIKHSFNDEDLGVSNIMQQKFKAAHSALFCLNKKLEYYQSQKIEVKELDYNSYSAPPEHVVLPKYGNIYFREDFLNSQVIAEWGRGKDMFGCALYIGKGLDLTDPSMLGIMCERFFMQILETNMKFKLENRKKKDEN